VKTSVQQAHGSTYCSAPVLSCSRFNPVPNKQPVIAAAEYAFGDATVLQLGSPMRSSNTATVYSMLHVPLVPVPAVCAKQCSAAPLRLLVCLAPSANGAAWVRTVIDAHKQLASTHRRVQIGRSGNSSEPSSCWQRRIQQERPHT
jgi:hypothetical protein